MKFMKGNSFCAIGFNSRLKIMVLQLYLIFSKKKIYIYKSLFSSEKSLSGWFIKKRKITIENRGVGEIKGVYYEINSTALDYAELYYTRHLENLYFLKFLNKLMRTDKFSCYIKKGLTYYFFDVLNSLYLMKEFSKGKKIIIIDSPPNRFILDRFCDEHKVAFELHWLKLCFLYSLILPVFLIFILMKLFKNGFAYRNRVSVKLYKYAGWGLSRPMLRDDYLIDNINFKKDDIVFYVNADDEASKNAGVQLEKEGYSLVDLNKCKLNVKSGGLLFINIFLVQPLLLLAILFAEKTWFLIEDMLIFYKLSVPHFLFLSNFDTKCHISSSDHGEIAETIVMNRFGCKNMLYHWSDMTVSRAVMHAFTGHNVYYSWGPIHHDFQKDTYFHDKVDIVGCIFLRTYFDAVEKCKNNCGNNNIIKRIIICDSSFANYIHFTEEFYLDYLDLVIAMCDELNDVEFIFKSKNTSADILGGFTSEERKKAYSEKINTLMKNCRFKYYDNNFQFETLIVSADLVVNMGMNSPATIALILGKEAVYYDTTGNHLHPFTKYKNQIVFDDKRTLIDHVKSVLNHKKSAFDYIDPDLVNQYEPYKDSRALDRLIHSIYMETNTPLHD